MEFIDYYKILEVTSSAGESDIKKAYRRLARKYHPDLNPKDDTSKKKFQEINEANEVLSDPEKRKKYDKYGKDWKNAEQFEKAGQQQQQYEGFTRQRGGSQTFSEHDFSDFFESMFGGGEAGGRSRNVKFKGQDFHAQLNLNLHDVYTTHKQTISVNGKNIRLTIPAGVENGQTIKITGHGSPGMNGGPNGDIFIAFSISNNTKFKRDGNNLYMDVDLDLYDAALGAEQVIDTFDGKVKLVVAAGTQNGTMVKLKGKGFPIYKKEGKFGDLYINYKLKIPTHLTEKEKTLFRELSKLKKHEN